MKKLMALVMAFRISAKLSLIYCVMLPILAVGLMLLIKLVHPIFERVFKTYDKLNNVVQENVRGIRVVKSFVREDRETEKFTSVSGQIYNDFCRAERIMAFNSPLMQLSAYGCIIAISWLGAQMTVAGDLSTGSLMSLLTYCSNILNLYQTGCSRFQQRFRHTKARRRAF